MGTYILLASLLPQALEPSEARIDCLPSSFPLRPSDGHVRIAWLVVRVSVGRSSDAVEGTPYEVAALVHGRDQRNGDAHDKGANDMPEHADRVQPAKHARGEQVEARMNEQHNCTGTQGTHYHC